MGVYGVNIATPQLAPYFQSLVELKQELVSILHDLLQQAHFFFFDRSILGQWFLEKVCLDKVGKELSFVFPYTNDDLRYSKGEACTLFRKMVGDYVKRAQQKLENCRDLQRNKEFYTLILTACIGADIPEDEVANMQEYQSKLDAVEKEIQEMLDKWNDHKTGEAITKLDKMAGSDAPLH
uniref:Uncharacterized protein n=1 Tax=Ditylenchus dipsaci TaxID=166011 RepID=A0A915EL11_9BILA